MEEPYRKTYRGEIYMKEIYKGNKNIYTGGISIQKRHTKGKNIVIEENIYKKGIYMREIYREGKYI